MREINGQRDTYYTLVSLARVPREWSEATAREVLERVGDLSFGAAIGEDRIHRIGANNYSDLFSGGDLADEHLDLFSRLAGERHEPDLFHVLVFNALRRLKRFEWALAVLDAQSAFEVLVASVLRNALSADGSGPRDIEALFLPGGRLDALQKRLTEIDRIASKEARAAGEPGYRFLGSAAEAEWRSQLYRVRHRVVHEGERDMSFDTAKRAVAAGLKAAHEVQNLRPAFNQKLVWAGEVLDLPHITESAGRLSRLFEA